MRIRPIQQKLKTTDYGARVAIVQGDVAGASQINLVLSTDDSYGCPSVLHTE